MREIGKQSFYEFSNKGNYIEFYFWLSGVDPPSKGSYAQTRVSRRVFNPCAKSVNAFKKAFLDLIQRNSKTERPDTFDNDFDFVKQEYEISGYYHIDLIIVKSRPRSYYTSRGVLTKAHRYTQPISKPDNDKTERAIWDILVDEGIIIDDSRITINSARKMWEGEVHNDVLYTTKGIGGCLRIY